MRVNLIVPCTRACSFMIVADNVKSYYPDVYISSYYRLGFRNIRIDDAKATVEYGRLCDIAWVDTWLNVERVCRRVVERPAKIYVTSRYNLEMLDKAGVPVKGVVPRIASRKALYIKPRKKLYDVAVIGKTEETDRKGLRIAEEVIRRLNLKSIWITDYKPNLKNTLHHRVFTLKEEEKLNLIAQAKYLLWLSKAEGFGLPVLEAMILGVPVIYSDAPAHNEYAVGYKIPEKTTETVKTRYGEATYHIVDTNEAVEITKQAIQTPEKQYKTLSATAKKTALRIQKTALKQIQKWMKDTGENRGENRK